MTASAAELLATVRAGHRPSAAEAMGLV